MSLPTVKRKTLKNLPLQKNILKKTRENFQNDTINRNLLLQSGTKQKSDKISESLSKIKMRPVCKSFRTGFWRQRQVF